MADLIYVAALTYKRPRMLRRLLNAWNSLRLPEGTNVRFLVIDNDRAGSARKIVESFIKLFEGRLNYIVEARPGIPAARNRALEAANHAGADFLCFNDDDGFPDSEWLVALIQCQTGTKARLAFGPQRPIRPEPIITRWQNALAVSLIARASFIERFAAKEGRKGRIATSGTYNWMCDVRWVIDKGIRFDSSRSETGGTDTFFREAVIHEGGKLKWCPNAIVYEVLQPERLNLRYQFQRARAQGINAYHSGRKTFPRVLRNPFGRMAVGVGLIVLPIIGMASFMLGVHMVGMAVGNLQARWGTQSTLYRRPD